MYFVDPLIQEPGFEKTVYELTDMEHEDETIIEPDTISNSIVQLGIYCEMVKRCPLEHLQGLRCALHLAYMPGKELAELRRLTTTFILNARYHPNRQELLSKLIPENEWPWERSLLLEPLGCEDPCTEEFNTDSESDDRRYDELDWLDAVRSISPETPQGALLVPPAERLKKYRREAEDKLNSYKEKANKLATGMAKELELPDTMVPKILKCLSGHDLDDFT